MKSSWRVQSAMAHMHRRAGPGRAWLSAGLVPEWVALAAKAGRRFQKPPKAPRSAAPAMPYRPLPTSARCGSPSLYWPGTGVRHGPCMHNGHRTGPQAVVGHRRLLGKPCCIPQIPQGPLTRQQCSPDAQIRQFALSTPIESSKSHFSCRSTPSDPPVRPLVVRGP